MFESVILILIILGLYNTSPVCFLVCFINFVLFFYNYILIVDLGFSVPTIIIFLNKLNSALLNPLIFLILFMLFSVKHYYRYSAFNYKYIYAMLIISIPSSIEINQLNYLSFNLLISSFAPTLTNGLLIIHPLLLYSFYVALIYVNVWAPLKVKIQLPGKQCFYPYVTPQGQFYLLGVWALFLGAWWSHQELNWGGFWSWDLVEIFLLVSVTYTILKQHYTNLTQISYIKTIFFGLNFVMYIFSVRYNLINSIHNFISQSTFLYKVTYFIICYAMLFIIAGMFFWKQNSKSNFGRTYKYLYIFLESLYLVLICYIFITYLGFYLASFSSLLMINIVPIVLNSLYISLLVTYLPWISFYVPFIEATLFSIIFYLRWQLGLVWILHLVILITFLQVSLWYNTILLIPLPGYNLLTTSLSYSSTAMIEFSQLHWGNMYMPYNLPWLNLYIANFNNSILESTYNLVIYSTPIFIQNLSLIFFTHKFFGKISISENVLIMIIVVILVWLFRYSSLKQSKIYF